MDAERATGSSAKAIKWINKKRMNLVVQVIESRNLLAMDYNGFSDPYVKLQLGRHNFRTRVVKKCLDPKWDEEFSCRVDDLSLELVVCVYDEDKYSIDDFIGEVKIPISSVFDAEDKSLSTVWYSLQPRNKKSKNKDCGEICLNIFLSQNSSKPSTDKYAANEKAELSSVSPTITSRSSSPSSESVRPEGGKGKSEGQLSYGTFDELMQLMESRTEGVELPSNLSGGVLIDQYYLIAPSDLNALLFSPDSKYPHDAASAQGKTELQFQPWKFEDDGTTLKRLATYINPASKLIKAVKAYEEQTYLKADGKAFAVLAVVSTPDVMYGSSFKVELLYCITFGPELPSGEQSSNLVISWRVNFLQSVMVKGMIENGAKQGLKDSFDKYATCLSDNIKCVDTKDCSSTKEQILSTIEPELQSDWKLAIQYFANFTVALAFIMLVYVLLHLWFARTTTRGLEFLWLDMPDSITEVVIGGLLFLLLERVMKLARKFLQDRKRSGSDHGIKAQGDGWMLTVALIEGSNLAPVDAIGSSDPYVVFTCNGKTRTSSIKFQKLDPQWKERFEFDAMDEPPSMLHIEVFDGPSDDAISLGHTEINFLKANFADLSDVWIPLQGKLAQPLQSKLHLRIFLDDNRCGNVVKDYLAMLEKEVGKKINLRSPPTNSAFQKLFSLPAEEFLINDFSCHLKLKSMMPLQGRLFLSPRIIGFNANLFGQKTTFYFLWVDIENIKVGAAKFASMGSQSIIVTLRKGRGQDARQGAQMEDNEGRLRFHFHSFLSFPVAHRTMMALWRARSLSPEQKASIVDEQSENKLLETNESGAFLGIEDVNMVDVYSSALPISTNSLMELFKGGEMEQRIMERTGCLNYSCTQWESVNGAYQRQVRYKYDKRTSSNKGEAMSTQQRSSLTDKNGWMIEEVMTLHGNQYDDHFNLHLRYQVEDSTPSKPMECVMKVSVGFAWLKSTRQQKRVSKNTFSIFQDRIKLMFAEVEKECINGT
ncbi:hypothetical protein V2J09_003277 [Rumex salicifolius]